MNNKLINNSTKLKNDIKRKYDDNTEFAKEFNSKLKDILCLMLSVLPVMPNTQ